MWIDKKNQSIILLFLILPFIVTPQSNLTKHVNTFIGTGGHGHTFPGAVLPFGMVQLSPDTRVDGSWDGCSGYHYSDSVIYGFSHTHLSGTGCSDWGDIMLMPLSTKPSLEKKNYSSKFFHTSEKASPGYYEVFLEDEKTKVELTVTPRVGIHRYNFPANSEMSVVLDLLHRDKLLSGSFRIIDSVTITGYRISEAWAKEQHCYFAIKFSQPILKPLYSRNNKFVSAPDPAKKETADGGIFHFANKNKPLVVKVAISSVNEAGALNNLNTEATHWDFEKYKAKADSIWQKQLQKVYINSNDKNKLTTFYSALYHCFIHPSLNMDCDNKYRGRDNAIHTAEGFTNYSVFSLWDTYRALHPLFTILEKQRTMDFINTFLHQYKQSGRLPVWEISGNETDCMIGYHSVSVIADAMMKKTGSFDTTLLYEAVKAASTFSGFGIPAYSKKGYLSVEDESESVSRTLEYSYDDWCISQIMKRLRKVDDYIYYTKRSQGYKNIFDASTGFMRPRKNGNMLSPFDAKEVNNYYTEANSWQYSFYVPHDVEGLIKLHGGEKKFEDKLDSLFSTGNKTTGRAQDDITGLIGQYAHGNEPSHHMAYLYNFISRPEKTSEKVSQIMNEFYTNSPEGLIGNEDCGQMSAWYVFSALGFYPVCPGNPVYTIGKPLFDTAKINLEDGKSFKVTSSPQDEKKKYVHSVFLGKNSYIRSFISHSQIMNGGSLTFSLVSKQEAIGEYGKGKLNIPLSKINSHLIIPVPLIESKYKVFSGGQKITTTSSAEKNQKIVYTSDGTEPSKQSQVYSNPITINSTCIIKTRVYSDTDSSSTTEARFYKKPNNWKITLNSKYNKQYTADGDEGIIDGIYGETNWRKGEWQGYQYQDFECVIDLKEKKEITSASINLLQDTRAWIIFPTQVDFYVSTDNQNFTLAGSITNTISAKDYNIQIKKFEKQFQQKQTAQYIKIQAKNFGTLPDWHEGKGDGAFIFIDEIEIK